MMEQFIESGMTFGPFDDASVFRIETSNLLRRCSGIKTVEFIWRKKNAVMLFVEAKSSSPIHREGNEANYRRFMDEITSKFLDSFHLFLSGLFERRAGHEEISDAIKQADYQTMQFRFVLIIKGHEETWLPPLKQELEQRLKTIQRIWGSQVIVLNDKLAREQHLIS